MTTLTIPLASDSHLINQQYPANTLQYWMKLLSIIILLVGSTSCTVISESQCRFADFGDIGYRDASHGKSRDYFNKYYEKCLAYEIDIEQELVLYDMGRERGLLIFCNKTRYSSQCDRGTLANNVKSQQHIHSEMLRLQTGIPKITTSLSH